tara:strand:- start:108 stop:656 length:549 start_codon:yes stop_codon:yes gene_type:complete
MQEVSMALESATYINQLVATNPTATDTVSQADDHLRLIKSSLQATFPNIDAAVTASDEEINKLDGVTASTAELNILAGATVTTSELNILDGVTVTAANINTLSGITDINQATNIQSDTSPVLGGNLNANNKEIQFQDTGSAFSVQAFGSDLHIKYGGTLILSIESNGTIRTAGDVVAFDSTP